MSNTGAADAKPELLETHQFLLAISATVLMLLPFFMTISNALDSLIAQFQAYVFIQNLVAPIEARMLAAVMQYVFQIPTVISGSSIIILGQPTLKVYVSWICVGWQSTALLAVTMLFGLRGPYTNRSRLLTLLAGFEGTYLVNLLRETSVILVNLHFGELPAILYHDYGGTVITITWLVVFWYFAFAFILKRK
jgi:exosortase/archaeosortase family protein